MGILFYLTLIIHLQYASVRRKNNIEDDWDFTVWTNVILVVKTNTFFLNWFQIVTTRNQYITDISAEQLSYIIRRLAPFTEYMISVSAFTIMGEGPPTVLSVRTHEQGKNVSPLKQLPTSAVLAFLLLYSH